MYVKYRSADLTIYESNIIKANIMVQIATNIALKENNIPKYDKKKLYDAIEYMLTLTNKHDTFYPLIKKALYECGINLVILPNLAGSKINGATKKINDHIMLMINDRNAYSDSFWFTLCHELGHIVNGDFGISFENQKWEKEEAADNFAKNKLIPPNLYNEFIKKNLFTISSIKNFAREINRDFGIVLGRLQKDGFVKYGDKRFIGMQTKYRISI